MNVFITGASGFIGRAVVAELTAARHQVKALARSQSAAKQIQKAGAEILMGSLEDLDILKQGASQADCVIHLAYSQNFSDFEKMQLLEKNAINTLGEALEGTQKPLIVPTGLLALPKIDGYITEESDATFSPRNSESLTMALAKEKNVHATVLRLAPSVHDKGDRGFVAFMVHQALQNGVSAYPATENAWSAVHRLDVAKAFRLALEKAGKGEVYNVVGEQAVAIKDIATIIGSQLSVPVKALSGADLAKHFDWLTPFVSFDASAKNEKIKTKLGWQPTQFGLLEDLKANYTNQD